MNSKIFMGLSYSSSQNCEVLTELNRFLWNRNGSYGTEKVFMELERVLQESERFCDFQRFLWGLSYGSSKNCEFLTELNRFL